MNPDKKLAFGLMRLPQTDPSDPTSIDDAQVCAMVDRFLGAGFTYFDTAAPYHGGASEEAFRRCVVERHPRDAYTVTDKLSLWMVERPEDLRPFFDAQLERLGVDYVDYYLLHAMDAARLERAEELGAFDVLAQLKADGLVRHVGFSFHDTADVLERILERHPEMEYVQLQLNYADWEDAEVQSRACHEVCEKHSKPVLVMEPVKGGLLANLPPDLEERLRAMGPERSVASWAIRFAASQPQVAMVLSGMSDEAQAADNLATMRDFQPLTVEEQAGLLDIAEEIRSRASIPCTACRYCVDGCPQKIRIPDYFKLVNRVAMFGEGSLPKARRDYAAQTQSAGKASDCVHCLQCEEHCPQHLPITELLEQVTEVLE